MQSFGNYNAGLASRSWVVGGGTPQEGWSPKSAGRVGGDGVGVEVNPKAPPTQDVSALEAMLTATRSQLSSALRESLELKEKVRDLETKLASATLYGDTMEQRVDEVQRERAKLLEVGEQLRLANGAFDELKGFIKEVADALSVSPDDKSIMAKVFFLKSQVMSLSDRIVTETDYSRYLKEELDGKTGLVAALTGDVERITKQRDELRESNKQYADGLAARTSDLSSALRKAVMWKDEAARQQRNVEYYRDTVVKIGELFGSLAYISDDGTVNDTVLCAKVPDLVKALITGNWSGIATPPVLKALSINAPTLASGAVGYAISDNAIDYEVEAKPDLAARVEMA